MMSGSSSSRSIRSRSIRSRSSDVPLFSPTQVPTQENVLSSIFAPPPPPPPPAPSPIAIPKTPTPRKRRPTRNIVMTTPGGDEFYSPMASSSPMSAATSSASSFRSYKSCAIPVEMLSFDYVSTCQSEQELNQIVTTLHADNKAPSLLRKAQSQLNHVLATSTASRRHESSKLSAAKSVRWAHNHTSFSPPSMESGQEDEDDSLQMSLSTTMLDESVIISSPWSMNNHGNHSHRNNYHSSQKRRSASERSTLFLQEELQKVQEERSALELQLSHQVHTLEHRLSEVRESNTHEQLSLVEKIATLETARWTAEENVVLLEHAMTKSSQKAQSVLASMDAMRAESETLRTKLTWQQQQQANIKHQTQQTEQQLRSQVATLATQLKEDDKTADWQTKLEQQLTHRNEIEESLQQSLKHARTQLASIRTEQNGMLTSLQHALGRDVALVPNLESSERRGLVQDVTHKLASSKAAVKAFAQAMASAEKDRYKLKEAHRLASGKVLELKRLSEKLSRENDLLVQQNGTLSEELDQTTAYADTLAKTTQDTASYQIREQEYKHTIALLKKQIRSGESVVSMALYQQAVKDGKVSQHQVKAQTAQIASLESNLAKLQLEGEQRSSASGNNGIDARQTTVPHQRNRIVVQDLLQQQQRHRPAPTQDKAVLAGWKLIASRHPTPPTTRPPAMATPSPQPNFVAVTPNPPIFMPPRQYGSKRLDPPASVTMPSVAPQVQAITPHPSPHQTASVLPKTSTTPRGIGFPQRNFGVPRAVATIPAMSAPNSTLRGIAQRQELRVRTHQENDASSPPPPPPPPPAATQRAYNRLSAIKAAGGSKGIREKLKQIRRSPLGNATNTSRGVVF